MNAYIILLSCINFYANRMYDYIHSLYKSPVSSMTFQPKYTHDSNLWTTDKLLITKQSNKPSKK